VDHPTEFLAAVDVAKWGRRQEAAALLAHPIDGAEICLMVDNSDIHVGASLQHRTSSSALWQHLGFFTFSQSSNLQSANFTAKN
jgi:hypothetical protein